MAIKIAGTEVINDNKRVLNNESLPDVRPSLLLDFANSKTLDPRITFTRGSTATYWDGKTTAKAEENLLKYSQEFDNAAWGKSANVTATANSTTAPDGTTTADTFVENDTTTDFYYFYQTVTKDSTARSYTFSTYAKQGSRSWAMITIYDGTNGNRYWFDLATVATGTTLTIGSGFSNISHSISDAGNGWCRLEINFTTLTGTNIINFVAPASADNTQTITGVVGQSAVYVWGAQLEQRSSATAYTATTTSPIVKYQPVLQTAASGEARFDHDPVTGESKGLLIEEARTNLYVNSEALNSNPNTNCSFDINTAIAPDGEQTAEKLIQTTTLGSHHVYRSFTASDATTYTGTVYAKAGELDYVFMYFEGNMISGGNNRVWFDLSSGTIGTTNSTQASIEDVGNGWYRCSVTRTTNTGNTLCYLSIGAASADTAVTETGDGYSGIYVWGAQVEQGSFPTSYIPTSGSTVTRSNDSASIDSNNLSWYSDTGGTVFCDAIMNAVYGTSSVFPRFFEFTSSDGGTSSDSIRIIAGVLSSYTDHRTSVVSDGGSVFSSNTDSETNGQLMAFAFETDNHAVSIGGTSPTTDTSGRLTSNINSLILGGYGLTSSQTSNLHMKKFAFYPKRLPNATLQAMTEA